MDPSGAPWRALESAEPGAPSPEPASRNVPWVAIGVVVVAVVVAAIALLLTSRSGASIEVDGAVGDAASTVEAGSRVPGASASAGPLVVEVGGAVVRPGVYRLPAGSRVGDAVTAAGGFGPRVDAALADRQLNLAAPLHDGDEVHVPVRGEADQRFRRRGRRPGGGAAVGVRGLVGADRPQSRDRRAARHAPRDRSRDRGEDHRRTRGAAVHDGRRPRYAQGPRGGDAGQDPLAGDRRAMSAAPARFPRSGWLAVGVAGAAAANAAGVPGLVPMAAGFVVAGHRPGGARRPRAGTSRPRPPLGSAPCSWASAARRAQRSRCPSAARRCGAMDRGCRVRRVAARRRAGRSAAPHDACGRGRRRGDAARVPAGRRRRRRRGGRRAAAATGRRPVWRLSPPVRRRGQPRRARAHDPRGGAARASSRSATPAATPCSSRCPSPRRGSRRGSSSGCASGSTGRPRRRLRDGRREPRRRDLGLEHRDRRGPRRGGAARTSASPRDARRSSARSCAYVVAAGASPSVVRAAVMAGVVLLARESGRAGRAPRRSRSRRRCC